MRDDTQSWPEGRADAEAADRAELAAHIDALMAQPAKAWPSIIVVGDDVVFGITPAARAH